jgi:hypothetical protein
MAGRTQLRRRPGVVVAEEATRRPVVRFYASGAAMFAEESGLRGAGAPDCRRLRHDGVVQEALRQRRARQPLASKAAQFVVTSAVADDLGDDGQTCAAQAIDVMTRKSCPRFSRRKRLSAPPLVQRRCALYFPPRSLSRAGKDQTGPPCLPSGRTQGRQPKSISSRLRGPPA